MTLPCRSDPTQAANSESSSAAIYAGLVAGLMVISITRALYFAHSGMSHCETRNLALRWPKLNGYGLRCCVYLASLLAPFAVGGCAVKGVGPIMYV